MAVFERGTPFAKTAIGAILLYQNVSGDKTTENVTKVH
jgi:hypothetical protein